MTNLLEYIDRHVTVTFRDEGENKTITGHVTKANAACILVRPKGRPFVLIDAEAIASIQAIDPPARKRIKVRSMGKILTDQVRQHLADRHAVPLDEIPGRDEKAEAMHNLMDHNGLGHHHRPDVDEVAERAAVLDAADSDDENDEDDDAIDSITDEEEFQDSPHDQ